MKGSKKRRINTIFEPKNWKICLEGKSKITEDDIIYKMIINESGDYQSFEITELISKDNYDNIIRVIILLSSELPILLFDEQQQLIPLVIGNEINYDKLNEI